MTGVASGLPGEDRARGLGARGLRAPRNGNAHGASRVRPAIVFLSFFILPHVP